MRKFTLFLASLLVAIGAMAQTPIAVSDFSTDNVYRIYNTSSKETAAMAFAPNSGATAGALTAYNEEDAAQEWRLIAKDGKYLFFNLSTSKYLQGVQGSNGVSMTSDVNSAVAYTMKTEEDANGNGLFIFNHADSQTNYLFNDGNGKLAGWTGNNNEKFYMSYVRTLSQEIELTYNFVYNGETKYTEKINGFVGEAYPSFNTKLPFGVVASALDGNVSADDTEKTIELSLNVPFEYASSYESIEHWYYMNIRDDGPTYLAYNSEKEYIPAAVSSVDKSNKDIYTWAFIGDPFNGFQIVNYAAGETMILSAPEAPTGDKNAAQLARMVNKDAAAGNTIWMFLNPTHPNPATNCFYIQHPTATSYAFNRQDYDNTRALCYWSGRDTGSAIQLVERPMAAAAELEVLIETIENAGITAGTIIGEYTKASVDALNSAVANAKDILTNGTPTAEEVATLQAAYDALAVILPTAGKYYQFHNALAFAETKAIYANGNTAAWKSLNEDDKAFYWEAVATDNGIALKNAANGKYLLGNADRSGDWSLANDATGAEMGVKIFSTEENEKGYQYGIVIKNWQMHTAGHDNGAGISGNIVSWNTDAANSASAWYIKEVELPTFYTVTYKFAYNGDTKYTQTAELAPNAAFPAMTIELPYGVTSDFAIPEGTVTENTTKAFALNIAKELPFKAGKWYYVQMHANGNVTSYIQDNKDGIVEWLDKDFTSDEIDSHLWKFEGDVFSGIKVINKGTGYAITSTSGDAETGDAANATAFFPVTSKAGGNWFCLRYPNSNLYLNAQGEQIKSFADNDNGSSFRLTEYKEHEVTVSAADYATLYLDYNVYIPADVEVYAAASKGSNYVSLAAVEGTIPANQGVILKNAGTYTFKTAPKATAIESNLLAGTVETSDITPAEKTTYYVLANGENGVGLYPDALSEGIFRNNANKAYLPVVVESGNAAPSYSFNFDWNGTTGIEGVTAEGAQDGAIYDITGRRVKAITAPGIYIVNGKKVVK